MSLNQGIESPYSPRARWYTIPTYTGYERQVQRHLQQLIAALGQPHLIDRAALATQENVSGYVLVHMQLTDTTWSLVRAIPGVAKGGKAQPYYGSAPG